MKRGLFGRPVIVQNAAILATVALAVLITSGAFISRRESEQRRLEFNYELQGHVAELYDACVDVFKTAARCSAIWRVVTQAASRDSKYTAGAGALVNRSLTRISFSDPVIRADVQTIWLWVAGGKLCLLPDRMLFFGPSGVLSLKYGDVHTEAMNMEFREDGPVPPDSTNVGTTWQYVNKNGGPDRRFAHNRQLPIQRYSDFAFTHSRLTFRIEFSRSEMAGVVVKTMQALATAYPAQTSTT